MPMRSPARFTPRAHCVLTVQVVGQSKVETWSWRGIATLHVWQACSNHDVADASHAAFARTLQALVLARSVLQMLQPHWLRRPRGPQRRQPSRYVARYGNATQQWRIVTLSAACVCSLSDFSIKGCFAEQIALVCVCRSILRSGRTGCILQGRLQTAAQPPFRCTAVLQYLRLGCLSCVTPCEYTIAR